MTLTFCVTPRLDAHTSNRRKMTEVIRVYVEFQPIQLEKQTMYLIIFEIIIILTECASDSRQS